MIRHWQWWLLWALFVIVTGAFLGLAMEHTARHLFGRVVAEWLGWLTPFLWAYHCLRVTQKEAER